MEDKAARSVGAVHRPSDSTDSSHPPPVVSTAEDAAVGSTSTSGGGGGVGSGGTNPSKPPPPYSGPATKPPPQRQSQRGNGPQYYPGLPVLDYRQYAPPLFELSSDKTTITSKASYLSENAGALATLIRSVAKVPPKPYIQVQGSRGSGHNKVDFSVKLNLMSLLVPEDASRRMDYLRCVGQDEMACRGGQQPALKPDLGPDAGLEDWCERFVRDPAPIKTFALERVVANLDLDWIEGQLRSLVAATDYKGVVTVQFPITHAKVVVQNPDKVNGFFTTVTSLFTGKNKYEVVKVVWPFATSPSSSGGGGGERQCVVQSERTWWAEWKDIIRYAIATKRRGWVTNEDKLEYIMEGLGREVPATDWDMEY